MGLKITKQIGTNRGLTSEAYVRIANYEVMKSGYFKIWLQVFQSQEDTVQKEGEAPMFKESVSLEIGSLLDIPLQKELTKMVMRNQLVDEPSTITVPKFDENGVTIGSEEKEIMRKTLKEVEVEEAYSVPDLTILNGKDIFEFGYTKLKEKLVGLFGEENVIDC